MIWPSETTRIGIRGHSGGDYFPVAGPEQWSRGVALASEDEGTDFDGMFEVPTEVIYNATAFQIGADYGGYREEKYDFKLVFHIKGSRALSVRQAYSEFRGAFSYSDPARIEVSHEGTTRWLDVRLGGKVKIRSKHDANGEQYMLVEVPLIGAFPRWLEDDATATFVTATDTTEGGSETGYLLIVNPCDVEIWLKWMIQGAAGIIWTIPDRSFGNDKFERAEEDELRAIAMAPLIDGEHVRIDTDPESNTGQVNSNLDTQIYLRMNGKQFMYPVLPGTSAILPVTVTGAPIGAGIQVRCPRTWTRPW